MRERSPMAFQEGGCGKAGSDQVEQAESGRRNVPDIPAISLDGHAKLLTKEALPEPVMASYIGSALQERQRLELGSKRLVAVHRRVRIPR